MTPERAAADEPVLIDPFEWLKLASHECEECGARIAPERHLCEACAGRNPLTRPV